MEIVDDYLSEEFAQEKIEGGPNEKLIKGYTDYNPLTYMEEFQEVSKEEFPGKENRIEEIICTVRELIHNSVSASELEKEEGYCKINSYFFDQGIITSVEDGGPGFDYRGEISKVKNDAELKRDQILHPDNYGADKKIKKLTLRGGRGLRALLAFSDDYRHSKKGNKVCVYFSI